jgi:chromosome segregation ATPase
MALGEEIETMRSYQSELTNLENAYEEAQREIVQLKEINQKLVKLTDLYEEAQQEISDLYEKNMFTQDLLREAEQNKIIMQEDMAKNESVLIEKNALILNLQSELGIATKLAEDLKLDLEFAKSNLMEEAEMFKGGLEHVNQANTNLLSKVEELNSVIRDNSVAFAEEKKDLEMKITFLISDRDDLQRRLDDLNIKLEEAGSFLSQETSKLHEKVEILSDENQSLKKELETVLNGANALESRLNDEHLIIEHNRNLEEENSCLKEQICLKEESLQAQDEKTQALYGKLRELAVSRDEIGQQLQSIQLELEAEKDSKNSLEKELEKLRKEYQNVCEQVNSLQSELKDIQDKKTEVNINTNFSQDVLDQLNVTIEALKDENEMLERNAQQEMERLEIELSQQAAKSEKYTEELKSQLDDSLTWSMLLVQERDRLSNQVAKSLEYPEVIEVRICEIIL